MCSLPSRADALTAVTVLTPAAPQKLATKIDKVQ